jgi:formate dehydrogenase iron-sulfur subunit
VKVQCLHCLEPACASACFVAALKKTEEGPVLYDGNRCVGCRYCLLACPFGVPTFEWDETFGRVQKCDLCPERTSEGDPTACAEVCPTGAITFGRRGELLRRPGADRSDEHYVQQVYGETEAAGTSVMYLSDVPFEELGFRTGVAVDPLPTYTWEVTRILPPFAAGFTVTIGAVGPAPEAPARACRGGGRGRERGGRVMRPRALPTRPTAAGGGSHRRSA